MRCHLTIVDDDADLETLYRAGADKQLNVISTLTKPVDIDVLEMLLLEACEYNSVK